MHAELDDDALQAYARAAIETRAYDDAAARLAAATAAAPDNPLRQNLAGAMLQLAERCAEALPYHERAVDLDPRSADYANNLGTSLGRLGRLEASEEYLSRAVTLDPAHYMAWYNLGNLYRLTRRLGLAERAYRRSIALYDTYPEAHFSLACLLLQLGRWREGWYEFEWRWQSARIVAPIEIDLPLWDGEAPRGRRILLVAEQGSGDTLQFVRYARALAEAGAEVSVWAPKETAALLRRLPFVTAAATLRRDLPPADVYLPTMSLPRILDASPETIPAAPYLRYDAERAAAYAARLGPRRERLRVGLAWAGNPRQGNDRVRSARLTDLAELFAATDVRWIGVQKDRAEEIAASGLPLEDWSEELESFDATAALFANLDGVVSVCTGPAHLAGGLGLPTACLLSWSGDWRWGLHETETPWYPTMRLVRQDRPDAWADVAARAAREVARWRPGSLLEAAGSAGVAA